jgi:hypothetical protein
LASEHDAGLDGLPVDRPLGGGRDGLGALDAGQPIDAEALLNNLQKDNDALIAR